MAECLLGLLGHRVDKGAIPQAAPTLGSHRRHPPLDAQERQSAR
jgi:hypothetical protein